MRKNLISVLCAICLIFTITACSSGVQKADGKASTSKELKEMNAVEVEYEIVAPTEDVEEGQILLSIEEATYTSGVGIGPAGEKMNTAYDES